MKQSFLILTLIFSFSNFVFAVEQKELIEDASHSAAKEIGRVIGRNIGQEIVQKMTKEDRLTFLDQERASLRGALLFRHTFQGSLYQHQIRGYIMATREGRDQLGRPCRELEMDFILGFHRVFEVASACLTEEGWAPTLAEQISFRPQTATGPELAPPSNGGGWLPPIQPR